LTSSRVVQRLEYVMSFAVEPGGLVGNAGGAYTRRSRRLFAQNCDFMVLAAAKKKVFNNTENVSGHSFIS
jgi:hypothetical protein